MADPVYRLGDLIDDYCPRCRLLLNHAVASLMETQVVKVICQTCHNEHAYRHGQGGKDQKKKTSQGPMTLFDQVLASASSASKAAETAEDSPKKKRGGTPARYISRRKPRPPRREE